MIKKTTRTVFAVIILAGMMLIILCPAVIWAAERLAYHHSGETDTNDYCLRVYDVSIGLSEIQACSEEKEMQTLIIDTANPVILIRDAMSAYEEWRQLSMEELKFDFSQFVPEASEAGYAVTVTAPAINMDSPSSITFYVYVRDNLPDTVTATIQFAGTGFASLEIDITNGASLAYSQLPVPIKDGFTFNGWYLDQVCTIPFLVPDQKGYAEQVITGDLTLYPCWLETGMLPQKKYGDIQKKSDREKNTAVLEEISPPAENIPAVHTTDEEKGISLSEIIILLACSTAVLSLVGNIVSDLRVLKWYGDKKRAGLRK